MINALRWSPILFQQEYEKEEAEEQRLLLKLQVSVIINLPVAHQEARNGQ